MELNKIFKSEQYDEAYAFIQDKDYTIQEIYPDSEGNKQFKIIETPKLSKEEELEFNLYLLRNRRQNECFTVINRGQLWYNTLTEEKIEELNKWYKDWLDVTETKVVPRKPTWLE